MICAQDITVVVPCLFPNTMPIWMLLESANRFGIPVRPFGIGKTYNGWVDMKVHKLKEEAFNCETSHILYTDARDAWFLQDLDHITDCYNKLGAPEILLSAQSDVFCTYAKWYDGIPWNMEEVFRYVGTPGQLCKADSLVRVLDWMTENHHLGEDENGLPDDDPPWWIEFMRAHPGVVKFDHKCSIFMNAGSSLPDQMEMFGHCLEFHGTRVYNKITDTYPAILHFNGGSSDALKGKWDQLEPFWRKCGHNSNPPWLA